LLYSTPLLSKPKNFSFEELTALLGCFDYQQANLGKTSGSRVAFTDGEGDSVQTLTQDFHNTVDEYLEFCEKNGKQPERPFKGSFNVRIQPELHRKAALTASARGISLNSFVEDAIRHNLSQP
jgi:predicted HicB family RNase H-like nuclease